MKVLIAGGAGFIGSHLAAYLAKQGGLEVHVLDNFSTGRRDNLSGVCAKAHEGSVCDRESVRRELNGVDTVFHLAALVSVPESIRHPETCLRINTMGTLNVLRCAAEAGVRKIVFASSSAVYGDNPALPLSETEIPAPQSPYALSKVDGEHLMRMAEKASGLEWVAFRYFNVFGPRQDPASPYAAALPIFIDRALRGEDLTIYGDGGQTRDFIHVNDVAAVNAWAIHNGSGVYNVGLGSSVTILGAAREILRITGSTSTIRHAPERLGDIRNSRADIHRLREAGFSPKGHWNDRLKETIDGFRTPRAAV